MSVAMTVWWYSERLTEALSFSCQCCSAGPPSARPLDQGAATLPVDPGGAGVRALWDASCAFPSRGLPRCHLALFSLFPAGNEEGQSHFYHRDTASWWQARVFEDWLFGGEKRRRVELPP